MDTTATRSVGRPSRTTQSAVVPGHLRQLLDLRRQLERIRLEVEDLEAWYDNRDNAG